MQGLPPQPSMCKSPHGKGRRNFHGREKTVGRARVNKESTDSHWLSPFEERSLSLLARAIDPEQPGMMMDVVKLLSAVCIVGEESM